MIQRLVLVWWIGEIYANPPDEYRNFPIDTLSSDVKYTVTAWAINEDDEVISPVATLVVSPINERVTLGTGAGFIDYLNTTAITDGYVDRHRVHGT